MRRNPEGVRSINTQLKVVTYNVHQWVGNDRLHDPRRAIRVLNEMGGDVIGLQEAVLDSNGPEGIGAEALAAATGKHVVPGLTLKRGTGHFGNVLLASHPVVRVNRLDLTVRSREPRCALDVTLQIHEMPVRAIVTHLGLQASEKRYQVRQLLESIVDCPDQCVVVMGDFNLWFPVSRSLRKFAAYFGRCPSLRTFPSRVPFLCLDRIWVHPKGALRHVHVHRSSASRVASDHLPLTAAVEWPDTSLPAERLPNKAVQHRDHLSEN